MKCKSLMMGGVAALASAALFLTPVSAKPGPANHDAAITACSTANPSQPVKVVNAVEDGSGIGFSLVWLTDNDGNLWMCDADAEGNVYTYSLVSDDLLKGAGPEMIGLQLASDGTYDGKPQDIAERVCAAYLDGGGTVLATADDGLENDPGFIVFVSDKKNKIYLCNATGDGAVWAFEAVGDPLKFDGKPEVS